MCGIAAQVSKRSNKSPSDSYIRKLLEVINYRGRDSSKTMKIYDKNNVNHICLGHNRLSIFDTSSAGNQPLRSSDGRYLIIFNGEIYNFKELGKILQTRHGIKLKSRCDTEVLIELWRLYKKDALSMLKGIYAFIIYDYEEEKIFATRDQYGIKPLWIKETEDLFTFCSELNAFLSVDKINKLENLDSIGLSSYLLLGYVPHTISIIKGYEQLRPGYLYIFDGESTISEPVYTKEIEPPNIKYIKKDINLSTKADVSIGCLLSGGVDSTSIASLASTEKKLICYTVDYISNNKSYSLEDIECSKEIAKKLNLSHSIIKMNADEWLEVFIRAIKCLSQPVDDTAIGSIYAIAEKAKEDGVKVLLSGTGGDEVYGGYNRYFERREIRDIIALISNKINLINNRNIKILLIIIENFTSSKIMSFIQRILDAGYDSIMSATGYKNYNKLLNRNFRVKFSTLYNKIFNPINKEYKITNNYSREILFDSLFYLSDLLLRPFDEILMRHTIEGRPGLLPKSIIHNRYKDTLKKRDYQNNKSILREILKEQKLISNITKKKTGFGGPMQDFYKYNSEYLIKKISILKTSKLFKDKQIDKTIKYGSSQIILRLFALAIWVEN